MISAPQHYVRAGSEVAVAVRSSEGFRLRGPRGKPVLATDGRFTYSFVTGRLEVPGGAARPRRPFPVEMHQIRYFLAVSRTLNFTRAAAECNVAQPSLTRAIKLLEAELGADLFQRERKLTHMTDFGQRMLPLLRQCHDSAVSAKKLATSIRKGSVVSLTLSLSRAVDLKLLLEPLRELVRIFPTLELKILRGASNEVAGQLKRGEATFAVSGRLGEDWERLDEWPLFEETVRAIVGSNHRFAEGNGITLADLAGERLLAYPSCELAFAFEQAQRQGVALTHGHEVEAESDLLGLVEENFGVAVLPASTRFSDKIRSMSIEDLHLTRTVALYGVAGRERSSAATAFMKLLRARDWAPLLAVEQA